MIDLVAGLMLKSTVGLLAAGLVSFLLPRRAAALRHAVWVGTVVGLLLLPGLTRLVPAFEVTAPVAVRRVLAASAQRETPRAPPPAVTSISPKRSQSRAVEPTAANWMAVDPGSLLAAAWIGGAALLLLRLGRDLARISRITRRARPLSTPARAAVAAVLERNRAGRIVTVVMTDELPVPVAWGWLRPVVLLPEDADTWPAEQLALAVSHELLHVRRGDTVTQLLAQTAAALWWPNPLAWWAAHRAAVEQERACDALVLRESGSRTAYAELLLRAARAYRGWPGLRVATPIGGELRQRVREVLDGVEPWATDQQWSATAAVAALMLWVLLGPTAITSAEQDEPGPASGAAPAPIAARAPLALALSAAERTTIERLVRAREDWLRGAAKWALTSSVVSDADSSNTSGRRMGLVDVLASSPRTAERAKAAFLLRELGGAPTELWLDALADSCLGVRWTAMRALRDRADPRAFDVVAERLRSDADPDVRAMAARAMGRYGTGAAVRVLRSSSDPEPRVRHMVDQVLSALATERKI